MIRSILTLPPDLRVLQARPGLRCVMCPTTAVTPGPGYPAAYGPMAFHDIDSAFAFDLRDLLLTHGGNTLSYPDIPTVFGRTDGAPVNSGDLTILGSYSFVGSKIFFGCQAGAVAGDYIVRFKLVLASVLALYRYAIVPVAPVVSI